MASYEEARVKLRNTELSKLKYQNKTGTALRASKKNFPDEELPHELFLTPRQKIKTRNTFTNNVSTNRKLNKAQLSKIILSIGFLGALLSKFAVSLMKVVILLVKNVLAPLTIMDRILQ